MARNKLLPKPSEDLRDRQAFDRMLLKKVVRYTAAYFLGVGKWDRVEGPTKEDVIAQATSKGPRPKGWIIYAICNHNGYEHSVQIDGIYVK